LKEKIDAVLNEFENYAADELVDLAEEILNQIASVGIFNYLKVASHKEVYNDFVIQLFNSSGHDYNAGPLFRWSANMIKDCPETRKEEYYKFFWEVKNGKDVLCEKVQQLAELRNMVMHGFFVLPPDKNKEIADNIGQLLVELHQTDFFSTLADYHFVNQNGFTGKWNITNLAEWNAYEADTSFGKLSQRIILEQSEVFWKNEEDAFDYENNLFVPEEIKAFINNNARGAFACWVHPKDNTATNRYAAIGNFIKAQKEILFIGYSLNENGISYTTTFLLNRLLSLLNTNNKTISKNKKAEEIITGLRKNNKQKVVILLNNIHLALFSSQHVSKLNNFLYDNNIILIAMGYHYEHFDSFFNQSLPISYLATLPNEDEQKTILHNYLRFKGPSMDKLEEIEDVQLLDLILKKVISELTDGKKVYARRFADEHNYDIEYVHEIFALLHPWVKSSRENFEKDTVDELYGFPRIMTEVTPIYLALGRRDLKLEYQHKVISINN
jgi:multimeric flavodoxin WrbA